MTDPVALAPCPFCGAAAEALTEPRNIGPVKELWLIDCFECGCRLRTFAGTEAEAIAAWNTRAAPRWLPIEEAPTGTKHPYSRPEQPGSAPFLLVWNGHHRGLAWGCVELMGEIIWWGEDGEPVEPPPTHYMPLPAPPEGDPK